MDSNSNSNNAPTSPFQDIYDRLPKIDCKGHCGKDRTNTCCGPIGCTRAEARLVDECDGIRSEWVETGLGGMVHQALDFTSLPGFTTVPACPHLGLSGRCSAYEARPLICRLWGVSPKLPCPWGCKPERNTTPTEERALWRAVKRRSDELERRLQRHA